MSILSFIRRLPLWFADHFLGTTLSLLALAAISGSTYAAVSYDVSAEPQMFLDVSITSSQTTGIVIASPSRNGLDHTFATTTGGILRLRPSFATNVWEDIHYTSASVNASTNKVTLSGVTRNVCGQVTEAITSCGNLRSWAKGTIAELVVSHLLLNAKLDADRPNTVTGSGSLESDQTKQPFLFPNRVTTAQRDAFTYGTDSTKHPVIFNASLGAFQGWNGSSWGTLATATGSFVNATTTVAGKVQLASTGAIIQKTLTGSTGAFNVLYAGNVTMTGGLTNIGKLPALNSVGVLNTSLGGTGTGSFTQSGVLVVYGTQSTEFRLVTSAVSGSVLTFDARGNPIARTVNAPRTVCAITTSSANVTNATYTAYDKTCTIPGGSLSAGETFRIVWVIQVNNITTSVKPQIDGTGIHTDTTSCVAGSSTLGNRCRFETIGTVRSIGATGTVYFDTMGIDADPGTSVTHAGTGTLTLDMTSDITIGAVSKKDSGGGSTNNLEQLIITVNPAP